MTKIISVQVPDLTRDAFQMWRFFPLCACLLPLASAVAVDWYACPLFTYPQPSGPSPYLDLSSDGLREALEAHISLAEAQDILAGAAHRSHPHPFGLPRVPLISNVYQRKTKPASSASSSSFRSQSLSALPLITAECADLQLPLYFPDSIPAAPNAAAANQTISVFVKRYRGGAGAAQAAQAVWFLQGGPGDSSGLLLSAAFA